MNHAGGICCVPVSAPPTLPGTAVDVVGSQVTFSAAFGNTNPYEGLPPDYYGTTFNAALGVGNTTLDGGLSGNGYTWTNNLGVGNTYQWQFISGGGTNNIAGATNLTLTLANLQLSNAGSYQLRASNTVTLAVSVSAPATLTVNSAPAAVNNVIISYAAQTAGGYGIGLTPTWTVAPGSVIYGQSPSSTNGDYDLEPNWGHRNVNSLTANAGLVVCPGGSPTTTISTYVTCGNGGSPAAGSLVIYTLTNTSAGGYNLTNITVYGGWKDGGRDQQAYTVSYSTVAAPTTFISLGTVNYQPSNPAGVGCATRAMLTPASGLLAANVAAVKFDFTTPSSENGYCGYSEINLSGVPALQPVSWAVGNGNWDTAAPNWQPLGGGSAVSYVENDLAAFDDSASGASPITVTLTGNHSPSTLTNNSTKNYILAGNYAITNGSLIKSGASTLTLDNGGTNGFTSVLINSGTVQVGNNDANGSLGTGNVTNNGALTFNRTNTVTVTNTISGSGGLVQNGGGRLVLSAVNPYTGNTTVIAGTLALTGLGAIPASTTIEVTNGATLDVSGRTDQTLTLNSGQLLRGSGFVNGQLTTLPGSTLIPGDTFGTMLVQSNITLNGTLTMLLDLANVATNDRLESVAGAITGGGTLTVVKLGPTLQPGDVFQLFNQPVSGFGTVTLPAVSPNGWANNLANNGTIAVVSKTSPPLTTLAAGGNVLTLTWPADHAGWQLQVQTNNLAQGLGTNWVNVAGSTTTNQMVIPMNENNGSVFYRLVYP
jgi:autotransporter-associated beta strand protein